MKRDSRSDQVIHERYARRTHVRTVADGLAAILAEACGRGMSAASPLRCGFTATRVSISLDVDLEVSLEDVVRAYEVLGIALRARRRCHSSESAMADSAE